MHPSSFLSLPRSIPFCKNEFRQRYEAFRNSQNSAASTSSDGDLENSDFPRISLEVEAIQFDAYLLDRSCPTFSPKDLEVAKEHTYREDNAAAKIMSRSEKTYSTRRLDDRKGSMTDQATKTEPQVLDRSRQSHHKSQSVKKPSSGSRRSKTRHSSASPKRGVSRKVSGPLDQSRRSKSPDLDPMGSESSSVNNTSRMSASSSGGRSRTRFSGSAHRERARKPSASLERHKRQHDAEHTDNAMLSSSSHRSGTRRSESPKRGLYRKASESLDESHSRTSFGKPKRAASPSRSRSPRSGSSTMERSEPPPQRHSQSKRHITGAGEDHARRRLHSPHGGRRSHSPRPHGHHQDEESPERKRASEGSPYMHRSRYRKPELNRSVSAGAADDAFSVAVPVRTPKPTLQRGASAGARSIMPQQFVEDSDGDYGKKPSPNHVRPALSHQTSACNVDSPQNRRSGHCKGPRRRTPSPQPRPRISKPQLQRAATSGAAEDRTRATLPRPKPVKHRGVSTGATCMGSRRHRGHHQRGSSPSPLHNRPTLQRTLSADEAHPFAKHCEGSRRHKGLHADEVLRHQMERWVSMQGDDLREEESAIEEGEEKVHEATKEECTFEHRPQECKADDIQASHLSTTVSSIAPKLVTNTVVTVASGATATATAIASTTATATAIASTTVTTVTSGATATASTAASVLSGAASAALKLVPTTSMVPQKDDSQRLLGSETLSGFRTSALGGPRAIQGPLLTG